MVRIGHALSELSRNGRSTADGDRVASGSTSDDLAGRAVLAGACGEHLHGVASFEKYPEAARVTYLSAIPDDRGGMTHSTPARDKSRWS
jgi:hypothetical protein